MSTMVDKSELLSALNRTKATVSTGQLADVLKCFAFIDGKLHTFNGVAGTRTVSPIPKDMNFAVPAVPFWRIVSKMPEPLSLELKGSGRLYITAGTNSTWLMTLPLRGFPEVDVSQHETFCEAKNFHLAVASVAFCVGKNARKAALLGVAIKDGYAYATDGKRAARQQLDDDAMGEILIPPSIVGHLKALGQPSMITRSPNTLGLFYKETATHYITRTLHGEFPFSAVDQLSSDQKNEHCTTLPLDIVKALDRVQTMAPEDFEIVLENNAGQLTLRSATENIGAAKEILTWDFQPTFKVAVRSQYLMAAIERTLDVDLTNVMADGLLLKFFNDEFDHILATMALQG